MKKLSNKDFEYLLNVSPEKAIEYLNNKGYSITRDWREVWKNANNKAFTIAGVMKEDILKDVKNTLIRSVEEGLGYENFKRHIESRMRVKGWYLAPWRLKFIYKQNMDIAYAVGRFQEQWSVKELVPYWQYFTMNDGKVRPAHAALHKRVFRSTDPIWKIIYPPSDWGCRCFVRNFSRQEAKKMGLKIESSKGKIGNKTIEVGPRGNKSKMNVKTFEGHIIGKGFNNPIGELFRK